MIGRTAWLTAVIGGFAIVGAQQSADQVTVPLTDPARAINLNLQLVKGGITVRGSNRRDVLVIARARGQHQRNEGGSGTGLREIVQPPAFTVTEERNTILFVLHTPERANDFEIQVPNRANLKLGTTAIHSGIVVEGVEGELEINNANGPITLNRVGGSVVANSVDGHVRATITSISMQRPMAFASFNRDVDVTFPASLKANLKLRSDNGQVLTDFDVTPLQQPTSAPETRREGGRIRIEINRFIYGAVNGGGPEIELRTFNGNIYVRRAHDNLPRGRGSGTERNPVTYMRCDMRFVALLAGPIDRPAVRPDTLTSRPSVAHGRGSRGHRRRSAGAARGP